MKIPIKITPELAEETGWHIGDGSMNYYNHVNGKKRGFYQLRGHHTNDKQHYIQRIKPIFKQLYDYSISLRDMPSTRVFGFQIWSNELVNFKQRLGLCLGKKWSVVIPEVFLESDELKAAVLRGIFDTDGCLYLQPKYGKLYPIVDIKTISPLLAEQMCISFRELGLRSTKASFLVKKGRRKRYYVVNIRGCDMIHKFIKIIKPQNPKHIAKYNFFCSKRL